MYKNNVCVPKASLFFLKKIKDKISDRIKDTKISSMKEFPVVVMTEKYPYSYDVIRPIERNLSKNGKKCKMTRYLRDANMYSYTFLITII